MKSPIQQSNCRATRVDGKWCCEPGTAGESSDDRNCCSTPFGMMNRVLDVTWNGRRRNQGVGRVRQRCTEAIFRQLAPTTLNRNRNRKTMTPIPASFERTIVVVVPWVKPSVEIFGAGAALRPPPTP